MVFHCPCAHTYIYTQYTAEIFLIPGSAHTIGLIANNYVLSLVST